MTETDLMVYAVFYALLLAPFLLLGWWLLYRNGDHDRQAAMLAKREEWSIKALVATAPTAWLLFVAGLPALATVMMTVAVVAVAVFIATMN